MGELRNWLRARGRIALIAMLLVLSLRLALPGGVMPRLEQGRIVAALCSGTALVPVPHGDHAPSDEPGKETPCAFAGLAFAAIGGGDGPALAVASVPAVSVFSLLPAALALVPVSHLRPPAHGPPPAFST